MRQSSKFYCRHVVALPKIIPLRNGFPSSASNAQEQVGSSFAAGSTSLATQDPLRLLFEETRATIKREAVIDATERVVPPLPPDGWSIVHQPGSRTIMLKKDVLMKIRRRRDTEFGDDGVRDRMEEELVQKLSVAPSSSSPFLSQEQRNKLKQKEERQRLLDSVLGAKQKRALKQREGGAGEAVRPPPPDTYVAGEVTIHCPFHCIDPSFEDSSISRAEWVPFDVRYTKLLQQPGNQQRPQEMQRPSTFSSSKEYASDCLFIQAASVDSKLHIRSVQLLPSPAATTSSSATTPPTGGTSPSHQASSSSSSSNMVNLLAESVGKSASSSSSSSSSSAAVDVASWGESSRFQREHNHYRGPDPTKLPDALHQLLNEWLVVNCELTPHVVEFICQMQYYAEHTEYLRWLGDLESWSQ